MKQKKVIISGLSGGSGKTLCSLGLSRNFVNAHAHVLPFKKGPDYIDTAWLSLAARKKAYNLDPFFLNAEALKQHFANVCTQTPDSIAFVEGNRGLYDGKDVQGSASTAELAVLLELPVILVINAQKCTRTLAAIVNGIVDFDKRLNFLGLIFNNTASTRHEKIIYESVKQYCQPELLGFIPRFKKNPLPERHLGLSLDTKSDESEIVLNEIAEVVKTHVNISYITQKIDELSKIDDGIQSKVIEISSKTTEPSVPKANIGYIMDKALWFYYTENLEALENEGAKLIKLSLFSSENWDNIDALYIGGGYPELYADEISRSAQLQRIKDYADKGMPIYAECGGFMLLTASICDTANKKHRMANIFDIDLHFHSKPQGLGYVEANVIAQNPYFPLNTSIIGHEFHYTLADKATQSTVFTLTKGVGMGNGKDALLYKNVFASYTHIYALSNPSWARNFTQLAIEQKESSNIID